MTKISEAYTLLRIVRNTPIRGAARSLRSLRSAVLCCAMLRKPDGWQSERVARADHLLQIILNKRSHLSAG